MTPEKSSYSTQNLKTNLEIKENDGEVSFRESD